MGIYDRDYYRQQRPSFSLRGPRTVLGTLILINVVVFLADGLLTPVQPPETLGRINQVLAVKPDTLTKPWMWWQFLTYGFAHASFPEIWHILGNMLVLFFLGRDVETLLVVAGVAWAVVEKAQGHPGLAVGASGAVTGIVVLYALNFPRRILLLFFVIPMPAWVVGLLVVFMDLVEALKESSHIAYAAHLGGAAFAFLYHRYRWNLSRKTAALFSPAWLKRRPKLRVHDPQNQEDQDPELTSEVDRILAKIHREGEASLTRKERRTLENASRQYQKRRQGPNDAAP
jgi:membrane associated rhomboid family serine protease